MGIHIGIVIDRWRTARQMLVPMASEVLAERSADIKELVQRQMYSGEDGYGRHFPPYHTDTKRGAAYARDKHERNPLPGYGNPDFYYSGAFYERMSVLLSGDAMKVDSDDYKRDYIVLGTRHRRGAGLALFRLNQDNLGKVRKNMLQPGLVRRLAQITGAAYA